MSDDDVGIWVQDATGRWHRSITFDGYDHGLACGLTITNTDTVLDTQMDTDDAPADASDVCGACWDYWRHDYDPTTDRDPQFSIAPGTVVTDGEQHDVDDFSLSIDTDMDRADGSTHVIPPGDRDQSFEGSFTVNLDEADDDLLDFFRMAFGADFPAPDDQGGDADD